MIPPSLRVLDAFGVRPDTLTVLPGGQGRVVASGDTVLKPIEHEVAAAWRSEMLSHLAEDEFRVERPKRARDGTWVVDGWTAWWRLDGAHDFRCDWGQMLELSRRFHRALVGIPCPEFLTTLAHPWAIADRVACDGAALELPEVFVASFRRLVELRRLDEPPGQMIHGDLSGNVLFAARRAPAIIDFSPYWRTASHATAIVAVDAVAWYGADAATVFGALTPNERARLPQAGLFRLVAAALCHADSHAQLSVEAECYAAVVERIESCLARSPTEVSVPGQEGKG